MIKKAAIYDPYLDTLGGGERYCMTVAETLLKKGYQVDIVWSGDADIIKKAEQRFDLNIANANIVQNIFQQPKGSLEISQDSESLSSMASHQASKPILLKSIQYFINKINFTHKYDLIFYISDWSLPFLFSKNNLLHVQVPFAKKTSLKDKIINRLKMSFVSHIVCNSVFTSNFASAQFGQKCVTIYPPVDVEKFNPNSPKENIIISVGRFDNILNSKKQDLLIESFKELCLHNHVTNWKLVLTGGSLVTPSDNTYLQHLKSIAKDYPIEFYVNPSFDEIKNLYQKSKIYWHAAGYDVDEAVHPENTEHFGMAPVEAMASGVVPIVVNRGGLSEIVKNNVNGYLWDTTADLISKTQILIGSPELLSEKSKLAIDRSKEFSKENFIKSFEKII